MMKVALGEIADIVSGATPKSDVSDYWGGNVQWVTPADLSGLTDAYISTTPRTLTELGLRSCSAVVLPPGSVLLSSRAPIGHVAITGAPMATNQGFKSLVPRQDRVDAKYLYHWLRANKALLQNLGNGATFKEISKAVVARVELPLPPLEKQRRIASILDQADALRTKRRQVLDKLDALVSSQFIEMFGSPLTHRRGQIRQRIDSIAKVVTGNSPSRAITANFGASIEWLKSDNLGGPVATPASEYLSEQGRRRAREVPVGSILVTCIAGSPHSIGKASIVDRAVTFNQQINAVLPSGDLEPVFLLHQLKVAPELVRNKSTGGMKGLVSKSAFESIEILTPDLTSQREFVEFATSVAARRVDAVAVGTASEKLFASLQFRAFRGEL